MPDTTPSFREQAEQLLTAIGTDARKDADPRAAVAIGYALLALESEVRALREQLWREPDMRGPVRGFELHTESDTHG